MGPHSSPGVGLSIYFTFPMCLLALLLACSAAPGPGLWERGRCCEVLPNSTPTPASTGLHILGLWLRDLSVSGNLLAYRLGRLAGGRFSPPVTEGIGQLVPQLPHPGWGVKARQGLHHLLEVPSGKGSICLHSNLPIPGTLNLLPSLISHLNPRCVGSVRKREHQRKSASFRTSSSPNPREEQTLVSTLFEQWALILFWVNNYIRLSSFRVACRLRPSRIQTVTPSSFS